jgi:hypothetical protein
MNEITSSTQCRTYHAKCDEENVPLVALFQPDRWFVLGCLLDSRGVTTPLPGHRSQTRQRCRRWEMSGQFTDLHWMDGWRRYRIWLCAQLDRSRRVPPEATRVHCVQRTCRRNKTPGAAIRPSAKRLSLSGPPHAKPGPLGCVLGAGCVKLARRLTSFVLLHLIRRCTLIGRCTPAFTTPTKQLPLSFPPAAIK